MAIKYNWPFEYIDHDIDINSQKLPRLWVAVSNEDKVLATEYDEWAFIACWTSLWDAENKLKEIQMDGEYKVIDRETIALCSEYRMLEIDDRPALIRSVDGIQLSSPTCYPTKKLYPLEDMLWVYMKHNETGDLIIDKDNNLYADTEPMRLLDTLLLVVTPEELCNYHIEGKTLIELAATKRFISCRKHLFDAAKDILFSKLNRAIVEKREVN